MVEIVAKRADEQGDPFQFVEDVRLAFQDGVHAVGHGESVGPVLYAHRSIRFHLFQKGKI